MIITRIARFQDSLRFRLAEWMLAIAIFNWGWVLLLPAPIFDLPQLVPLRNIAPQWAWGTALLLVGSARILILIINGGWRRQAHGRMFAAMLSGFAWLQITLGILNSGIIAPGALIYPLFLGAEFYLIHRCATEARVADEEHRNGRRRT